jgi:hypothetical protein
MTALGKAIALAARTQVDKPAYNETYPATFKFRKP